MLTGQAASMGIYKSLEQRANLPSSMTFETNGTQKLTEPFKQWIKDIPEEIFFSVSPKLFTVSGEKTEKAIKPENVKNMQNVATEDNLNLLLGQAEENGKNLKIQ